MIANAFNQKRSLFISFIVAGHPNRSISLEALLALAEVGADVIEVGVPFSDPIADGPVIQKAADLALANGMNLKNALDMVSEARKLGCKTPIILFSYLNPILAFGPEAFIHAAKEAAVDGLLIVDMPPDEQPFFSTAKNAGLEIVLLASPTTRPERLALYQSFDPSFIYYISRLGVTGPQEDIRTSLGLEVSQLRERLPGMKIAVGFGISNEEQARKIAAIADGVIVGSQLVKILEEQGLEEFKALAARFSEAVKASQTSDHPHHPDLGKYNLYY